MGSNANNVARADTCTTLEEDPKFAPLPNPANRLYLTEKADYALRAPNFTIRLWKGVEIEVSLYQITMTGLVRADEYTHDFYWFYKAEVSFDMSTMPPTPYLSSGNKDEGPGRRHTLNPFPPGLIRGLLRRPDIIIVRNPADRWPGRVGMDHDGAPHGENLLRVVEIKFPGDKLGEAQRVAYVRIAGDRNRFSVCNINDCEDEDRDDDDNGDGHGGSGVESPIIVPPPIPNSGDDDALQPAPIPAPGRGQRFPAPVYGPVPQSDPAWYERLAREAQQTLDEIADALSRQSQELLAKLDARFPWIRQAGQWIHDQANDAWVWLSDQGEKLATWTTAQLKAAWAEIRRQTDIVWEQLKDVDWGGVLLDIGEAVVVTLAIAAAAAVAVIVAVVLVELVAALIALIGMMAAGMAAALAAAGLAAA